MPFVAWSRFLDAAMSRSLVVIMLRRHITHTTATSTVVMEMGAFNTAFNEDFFLLLGFSTHQMASSIDR